MRKTRSGIDAKGGQQLPDAINELKRTDDINKMLVAEGFNVAYTPLAYIDYGIKFTANSLLPKRQFTRDFTLIYELPWSSKLYEALAGATSLVASVMQIKGDTRLPEIYRLPAHSKDAAAESAYLFGLAAGAQKRITDSRFYWSMGASHLGNYVIFLKGNQIFLSMVDFEEAKSNQGLFAGVFRNRRNKKETTKILKSLELSSYSLVEGVNVHGYAAPEYFREAFVRGFREGYGNPDKRKLMTLELLCEAYDLSALPN